MFSLTAHDIPSLLLENQGKNGFYFLTLPSHEIRTYRITMETVIAGVSFSRYYDFQVDARALANDDIIWDNINPNPYALDGAVLIGIPFNRNSFKNYDLDPEPLLIPIIPSGNKTLAQIQLDSEGPNTYAGETFKLLLLEPYISSVNLVEIDKDYYLGPAMIVRFVYWRSIGGEIVFTGSFGDPLMDTVQQLEDLRSSISLTDIIRTINTPPVGQSLIGRRYYIFRVTNTPNIIFSELQPSSNTNENVSEYSLDGINYRLTVPGDAYNRVSFLMYLNTLDSNGILTDPPSSIRVVSLSNVPVQVLSVVLIPNTKTLKLTLKTMSLADELDLYVYTT